MGWEEMTRVTCRSLGGFDPDVATAAAARPSRSRSPTRAGRHAAARAAARRPPAPRAVRAIAEGSVDRSIFAARARPTRRVRRPPRCSPRWRAAAGA
jgi:hypothetical protein